MRGVSSVVLSAVAVSSAVAARTSYACFADDMIDEHDTIFRKYTSSTMNLFFLISFRQPSKLITFRRLLRKNPAVPRRNAFTIQALTSHLRVRP